MSRMPCIDIKIKRLNDQQTPVQGTVSDIAYEMGIQQAWSFGEVVSKKHQVVTILQYYSLHSVNSKTSKDYQIFV